MSIVEVQSLRRNGQFDAALQLLERIFDECNPPLVEEKFNIFFARRDVNSTISVARQLQRLEPTIAVRVLSQCGLLLRESGAARESVEFLNEALNIAGGDSTQLPEWFYSTLYGAHSDRKEWQAAADAALAGANTKPILYVWASHAHRALRNSNGALQCLEGAIFALADYPQSAETVLSACRALLAEHPGPETARLLERATIAFGINDEATPAKAARAAELGDWQLSALLFSRYLDHGINAVTSALKGLTQAVRNEPKLFKRFIKTLERAITIQPNSQEVIFLTHDYLCINTSHPEAISELIGIQQRGAELFPALIVEVARAGKLDVVRQTCKGQINVLLRSLEFRRFERFLNALCYHEVVSEDMVSNIRALHHSQLRQFLLLRTPEIKVVRPRDLKDGEAQLLKAAGISLVDLSNMFERLTTISPEYDAFLDQADIVGLGVRDRIRREETYVAFQDKVVRDRRFDMVDPFTGSPCELFDSVMIFDRQVFSFRGKELFAFISGGNMNAGVFLFILGSNLLLQIDTERNPCSQGYYGSEIHMAELLAVYLDRAAKHYGAYARAIAGAALYKGHEREIVAIHGRAENPAHHIWNYLPPFERLKLLGVLGNISAIVRPPTQYFGDLRDLFPELDAMKVISIDSQSTVDPSPFSLHEIAIWLGGNFIPRNLQMRIRRWASASVSVETHRAITSIAERHDPTIWIGLRSGDKVWTNQIDGIIEVIDAICAEYSGALFLLDGFSLPDAGAHVPEKWRLAVDELSSVANQICLNVRAAGCAISLIGNTIAESVIWAGKVSTYFAPLGSSQHKVGWYCAAPGIIYTTSKVESVPPALRPGAWEAEGSPVPDFIIGKIASSGKRRGKFDFRVNLENVDFKAATVIELMKKNIATALRAKTDQRQ